MTFRTLIKRSLRHHARAHAGVIAGAAIGTATLVGALVVGDSVRHSLRQMAVTRLGETHFVLQTRDKLFRSDLLARMRSLRDARLSEIEDLVQPRSVSTALLLPATAAREDGTARANRINVLGVDLPTWPRFAAWPFAASLPPDWARGDMVLINEALANQLKVGPGDEILLRVRKPSALALDAVISPQDDTALALRLKIGPILTDDMLGGFSLSAGSTPALNAFLPLEVLSGKVDAADLANLLVYGPVVKLRAPSWWDRASARLHSWWNPGQTTTTEPTLGEALSPELGAAWLNDRLNNSWSLEDAGLSVRFSPASTDPGKPVTIQITTRNIFLRPGLANSASNGPLVVTSSAGVQSPDAVLTNRIGVLTYVANLITAGPRATPYSMITAAAPPFIPEGMQDDEILINAWLAEDLQATAGDILQVSYYLPDSGSKLIERTNRFRVKGVVPIEGIYADRSLMPEFPGLAKAERTQDWDAGFPLEHEIRDKDEAYWKEYRGTPKAFITLAAGQAMWSNRFGDLTSIRYMIPANASASTWLQTINLALRSNLSPGEFGLRFEPIRAKALAGANQSQDFASLFIGFSLFLIAAALLLMAMSFRLALERRVEEVGILLAIGWPVVRVRRLLLAEGTGLALIGGLAGTLGGLAYAAALIAALGSIWRDAIGNSTLTLHVTATALATGLVGATLMSVLLLWLTLRGYSKQPAHALLTGEPQMPKRARKSRGYWIGWTAIGGAVILVAAALARGQTTDPGTFFGAGALLLVGGISLCSAALRRIRTGSRGSPVASLATMGYRSSSRQPSRSLAVIGLLAAGTFIIGAIGAFRLEANRDADQPTAGTGGFAMIGEATLPVSQDLNTSQGREAFGVGDKEFGAANVVAFRVRDGDEASCLNLSRAQRPRLLGVHPETLKDRFTFSESAAGLDLKVGWELLRTPLPPGEVPAIGDANSTRWALGLKPGQALDYVDEQGNAFKLRIVATVANSILQGNLVIDEARFTARFPGESGYRWFLIASPPPEREGLSATLSRALQDHGLELVSAVDRLNQFNAVQNTYLGTFQMLGGLGVLLGTAGLGVLVFRNVLERRGELALLTAVGFRKRHLTRLLIYEHAALLCAGLLLGMIAAAMAVLPGILAPAADLPWFTLGITFAAVLANGMLWVLIGTRAALKGDLLSALRNE